MSGHTAQRRSAGQGEIPDRLYYRIGDVARLVGVEPYVLRFWETQFSQLKPNKGGTGQRLYRRRDLDMALRIKKLVHEEGYTIAGARQILEAPSRPRERQSNLKLRVAEVSGAVGVKGGPAEEAGRAGNGQTGNGQAGNGQAGNGQAGNGPTGNGQAGSVRSGDRAGNWGKLEQLEQARATIGRVRSELREIAMQLSQPEPTVARRRARTMTLAPVAMLFPE